jgi:hypothetical protein
MQSLLDQLWELDKEQSYARLPITPIREGDKRYYQWQERGLKIEVVRKPEMTIPEYDNERRRERLEHSANNGKISTQLSLM